MSWKEIYTVVESDANIDALPEGDDPFVDKLQKEEMHRNPRTNFRGKLTVGCLLIVHAHVTFVNFRMGREQILILWLQKYYFSNDFTVARLVYTHKLRQKQDPPRVGLKFR